MTDFQETTNNNTVSRSQDHYDAQKQQELQLNAISLQHQQNAINQANLINQNNIFTTHLANLALLGAKAGIEANELKSLIDSQTQVVAQNEATIRRTNLTEKQQGDNDEDARLSFQQFLKQMADNDDLKNVFETLVAKYLSELGK